MTAPSTPVPSSSSLVRSASFSASGLVRSTSFSSFHSRTPTDAAPEPYYPEGSSKYALRDARVAIDFSLPGDPAAAPLTVPLAYAAQNNVLYFPRGNRVHYKSLVGADVGQLCKLPDTLGDLALLAAADSDAGLLALATSTGAIQLWDATARKLVCGWTTKGGAPGALAWRGGVLAVGGPKGAVRHYDTRVQPAARTARVTRHQAGVAALAWGADGHVLASGDAAGVVYCWDARSSSRVPLDVGEFLQRRKKIQHTGAISAIAWCPWQPKLLATGDVLGTVRLWSVDAASPHSNAAAPGTLALGGAVVGLHFAPHYKELLSVLGPAPSTSFSPTPTSMTNAAPPNGLAAHALPSLRPITHAHAGVSGSPSDAHAVTGSILAGHKVVLAVPAEGKLRVFDAWGKRKEVRRQGSFLGNSIR
ncbi:WD40 repeat-like protein [Mycena latifolia]|nr:WD40 repeat-like protein [Mycena latifolia]